MWKYLYREVPHSHFAVEVFKFALDHDVKCLEEERVEVGLHLLFTLILLKLLELFCFHSHEGGSVFPGEVDVNGLCEI